MGLDYLTLGRGAPTLSGGESQRIRLASQLGSGLCGVLYVLDEPTIGLHPRDNTRLLARPAQAARPGQHAAGRRARPRSDRELPTTSADFGPARRQARRRDRRPGHARRRSPSDAASVTGPYLSGKKAIPIPTNRRMRDQTADVERSRRKRRSEEERSDGVRFAPLAMAGWKSSAPGTTTCATSTCAIPLGTLTAVTGVERQRQEFAGRRRAVRVAGPHAAPGERRFPARTTRSAASSTSTR